MNLDYLEIGACDFKLLCSNKKKKGLTIEPVEYYFNKLPTEDKLKIAISIKSGFCPIYSLPESIIKDYYLPWWLKGCSSINKPHPQVLAHLKKKIYQRN